MLIRNLELLTHKLDQLHTFYGDLLGFRTDFSPEKFSFHAGNSQLLFRKSDQPAYYHFAFNIPFDRLDEARTWLEERVELLRDEGKALIDFPAWKAQSLYFVDPAGNILEFIGRKDRGPAAAPGFSLSCVECVSEAGLPVRDVDATARILQESGGVPHYSGAGPVFRALGDPEGLLIVVNMREKTWYPTDKPARPFPLKVHIKKIGRDIGLHLSDTGEIRIVRAYP